MKLWTETSHCRSEAHCRTCRNLENGRAWREETAGRFSMPEVDWLCPRGHKWGYEGKSRGLGDTVAKIIKTITFGRIKRCGGCKKRQAKLNKLVPYKG